MRTIVRQRGLLVLVVVAVLVGGCSGASETTTAAAPTQEPTSEAASEPAPPAPSSEPATGSEGTVADTAQTAAFCDGFVEMVGIASSVGGPEEAEAALQQVEDSTPDQLSASVGMLTSTLREAGIGERPLEFDTDAAADFFAADTDIRTYMSDECGYPEVPVQVVRDGDGLTYDGLPETLDAGIHEFGLTSDESGVYLMAIARITGDVPAAPTELSQEDIDANVQYREFVYVEDGTPGIGFADLEPGRYLMYSFDQAADGEPMYRRGLYEIVTVQ